MAMGIRQGLIGGRITRALSDKLAAMRLLLQRHLLVGAMPRGLPTTYDIV